MWLSPTQIAAANYALRDLIARRTLGGQPIRQEITDLHKKLVAASAGGTQGASPPEELTTGDLIGTKDAAAILRCSTRWVRRIHVDLEGQNCGKYGLANVLLQGGVGLQVLVLDGVGLSRAWSTYFGSSPQRAVTRRPPVIAAGS
jgi:hypothetical protein